MFPSSAPLLRVAAYNRGHGFSVSGTSGIIAAALAQDSLIFALKCGAQAAAITSDPRGAMSVVVSRIRFALTTLTAFTTPLTAARRFGLYRATNAGAEISGQTDLSTSIVKKATTNAAASAVDVCRIANTGAITAGGLVREANPIATIDLAHSGAAGARQEFFMELAAPNGEPLRLMPTQYLVLSNPVAMDAAGTLQLTINELCWSEARDDDKNVG